MDDSCVDKFLVVSAVVLLIVVALAQHDAGKVAQAKRLILIGGGIIIGILIFAEWIKSL
jgi:hypothetical protein